MAPPDPLTAEDFAAASDVSRETLARLETYLELLTHWQRRINLVGPSTLADPWRRHFLDSAQLLPLIPEGARTLLDLGSGAGFPGLVLSILGMPGVHLMESDSRKCAFLREAIRVTEASAQVVTARIETFPQGFPHDFRADVITARALAPLDSLLSHCFQILSARESTYGVCLFLKGRNIDQELTESAKHWTINAERVDSVTEEGAVIVKIQGINAVHDRQ